MTDAKLAHLARLLQDLNQNFHDANVLLSKAWGAHEKMRNALELSESMRGEEVSSAPAPLVLVRLAD